MHAYHGAPTDLEKLERDSFFRPKLSGRAWLRRSANRSGSIRTPAIAKGCAIGLTILILLAAGLELRRWTWTQTTPIRFRHDIDNALYWGGRVLDEGQQLTGERPAGETISWTAFFAGYLALYDVAKQEAYEGEYHLDYPPLRLLVMALWAKHTQRFHGAADKTSLEVVMPMLACNFVCEVVSAATIFLLVRLWIRRDKGRAPPWLLGTVPRQHRGWVAGLLAASCLWLNPSVILEAYGWPQWDVWVLPFFLLAALAASTDRWFWCGCLLALGAMFKGQLLLVAPLFLLWPLWLSRWSAACRVLAGLVVTSMAITFPWLIRDDFSWLRIGFVYGTEHYPQLFVASCYNLPALLAQSGWSLKDTVAHLELSRWSVELTVQWALRLLYLGSLAACSWITAVCSLRKDARILLSFAAPWLLMFALLGQMHERYLLWGGAVTAVAVVISLRATLLHLLFTTLSSTMILHVMLLDKKLSLALPLMALLKNETGMVSIICLAATGAFFWLMARPARRSSERPLPKGESEMPIAVVAAG